MIFNYNIVLISQANILTDYLFYISNINEIHVRWGPCHHSMTCPQVVDGRTTKGGPPAGGLGLGLITFTVKNKFVTNNLNEPWTWTDSLDKLLKRFGFGL
jgi:hypothetical protein